MIGLLKFAINGNERPAYTVDAAGNLIRCSGECFRDGALIPGAAAIVSTAVELVNPQAWTLTLVQLEKRLAFAEQFDPSIRRLYPDLKIPVSGFPFAPFVVCDETDEMIMKAISLVGTHDENTTSQISEHLESIGIFRIPRVSMYNANIHEAAEGSIPDKNVVTLSDGWFSHMKVYRKSVVS